MLKKMFCTFLLLMFCALLHAQATLEVKVNNISSSKGNILFALFNQPDGFPKTPEKAFALKEMKAVKGEISAVFQGLPAGTYALAVFHDANGDGKLNSNAIGIPKEDYGFSNNARPMFSAPEFSDARFAFTRELKIVIRVN